LGSSVPTAPARTTTLKILSGILRPSSGTTQVAGYLPSKRDRRYLSQIALVMGQKNQLWFDLPAIETFELNRAIYEIPKKRYKKTLDELVELLEMKDYLRTQVRRLSLGQRMRMELIASLLHQPKVIFLDEPTIGLDIIAQQKIRDFVAAYNRTHKATILLTSHNMDDVANLAKRVIVINMGKIVFDGDLAELVAGYTRKKVIKACISGNIDYKKLEKIGEVGRVNLPEVEIIVPRKAVEKAAVELLQNFVVEDLTIEVEPIENIIARVFRSEK